ncbi:MAG: YybH family protein [Gammaproteobacteria bacterium]
MPSNLRTLALGLLASASIAAAAHADPAREIQVSIERLQTALDKGDLDAVAGLYAENAVIIPSESEILHTKSAIRSFWADQITSGADGYRIDVVDSRIEGDRAYVSMLWSATVNTHNGGVVIFDGNLTNVLQRQRDGDWKISLQSWN